MIVDNTLDLINISWFHSISVFFVIYHYFCLWSKISNVRLSLGGLPKMSSVCFIKWSIPQIILFLMSILNNSSRIWGLYSSLHIIHYLSSHIVWKESLFINTLIRQQFIEICLSSPVSQHASVVQVLVDSHRGWKQLWNLIDTWRWNVQVVSPILFCFHK